MLPKYGDAKSEFCQVQYQFATVCLQNDRPKSSQNNTLGRPQTLLFAQSLGVMVPLEQSSPSPATRTFRKYQS